MQDAEQKDKTHNRVWGLWISRRPCPSSHSAHAGVGVSLVLFVSFISSVLPLYFSPGVYLSIERPSTSVIRGDLQNGMS